MSLRQAALTWGESLFRTGVWVRDRAYRLGLLTARRLDAPVVSIGNLTVGGTGKSPLTVVFCRLLRDLGRAPAILSRGYRGSAESSNLLVSDGRSILCGPEISGDEPWMLAHLLPGIPVAVGANRLRSGRLVLSRLPDPHRVFVLDDGFQHRQLTRNLDLVAIDATVPLPGLRMLPAGTLREPVSALRRADAVLLTRCHQSPTNAVEHEEWIRKESPCLPVFRFRTLQRGYRDATTGEEIPTKELVSVQAVAVAAIGNPKQLLFDLGRTGLRVVNEFLFPDHHAFTQDEVAQIVGRARKLGAETLVTTEKDAVRLRGLDLDGFPCRVLQMDFVTEQETELRSWLENRLPPGSGAAE